MHLATVEISKHLRNCSPIKKTSKPSSNKRNRFEGDGRLPQKEDFQIEGIYRKWLCPGVGLAVNAGHAHNCLLSLLINQNLAVNLGMFSNEEFLGAMKQFQPLESNKNEYIQPHTG